MLDTVEKQSIVKFSRYRSSYQSHGHLFEVGENAAFRLFLCCISFIDNIAELKKHVGKFSRFHYFRRYFVEACSFSEFLFSIPRQVLRKMSQFDI